VQSLAELLSPIAPDMQRVDAVIRDRLNSDVVLIRTIGDYIIGAGGKRLRPAMVLLMAKACDYKGGQEALMAAVVEFIHTATLLHDDVVDESALRRGRSTANAVFGNPASVLVGDYLYSRAFEMMVEVNRMDIMRVMAEATTVISEGEVLQLLNVNDPDVTEVRYLDVVRFKTAKLFEAAARVGALLANVTDEQQEAAAAYGRHLGTAFQLIDDLLDYSGDVAELGKSVGDDLREGKPTLPLLRVMAVGTPEQQALIRHAIETGEGDFEQVARAIQQTDALTYTQQAAQAEIDLAVTALMVMPATPMRQTLQSMAAYSLTRST
jgi:octaprenyl-diphosphate synthase